MASNLEHLNFMLILYVGDSKVARITCNFLMADATPAILEYWINDSQEFYTHVGIDYQGKTLIKVDLKNKQKLFDALW